MASIVGVKVGTSCDHLIRRSVTLFLDDTLTFPFSTTDQEFWCRVDSDIYLDAPQFSLFVNEEEFTADARVGLPDEHLVIFNSLAAEGGGFGFGGFGEGGYGFGGFGIGIAIESQGSSPGDDVELQYRTTAQHCPKCVLKDGNDNVVRTPELISLYNQGLL